MKDILDYFITTFDADFGSKVAIQKGKDETILYVDLPGVNKEDISLEYENGYLVIRAERKKPEGLTYYEQSFGKFERSIRIDDIDFNKTEAEYSNGVLTIKIKRSKKSKSITIK